MAYKEEKEKKMYEFALELKKAGFKVITNIFDSHNIPVDKFHEIKRCAWLHFSLDGKLWGYVGDDFIGSYTFSIDYKPSRQHGSGEAIFEHTALTVENAQKTLELGFRIALKRGLTTPYEDFVANKLSTLLEF